MGVSCGYHKWTYATDGSLLHAESQPPSFTKECFGLKNVAARSLEVFRIHLLKTSCPLSLGGRGGGHRAVACCTTCCNCAARIDLVEEGNWKLVIENNRECYHCDGHPELICSLFQLFGYSQADLTPRLRPVYDALRPPAALREVCEANGVPLDTVEELDNRVTGFRCKPSQGGEIVQRGRPPPNR